MTDRPFREHEFLAPADASPARHSITYSDILDLIVQNASRGSRRAFASSGGRGYRPARSSDSGMPGARWHPVHIAA